MPINFTHFVIFGSRFKGFVRTVQVRANSNQGALDAALDYVGDNEYVRASVVPFEQRTNYVFVPVQAEAWVVDLDV